MSVADKLARKSSTDGESQVRLHLVQLGVWSIVKFSTLLGAFLAVVGTLSTLLLWAVLDRMGVFDQIDALISGVSAGSTGASSGMKSLLALGNVAGASVFSGVIGLVVGTAVGAVASLLYNLSVRFTGGLLIGFISPPKSASGSAPRR